MIHSRAIFQQSILQYTRILEAVNGLVPEIESGQPERLRHSIAKLEVLHNDAALTDSSLNDTLRTEEPDRSLLELLDKRKNLMSELGRLNRLLVSQLDGRMSLLASELRQGKQVRRAMTGYRHAETARGYVLAEQF